MAEESNGISSEPEEVSPNEVTQEILEEGQSASVSAPLRGRVSLGHALARAVASTERFFRSIGGSKVRLSVAAGLFAALATAIGFATFDAQREQWALKQKYPEAVSSAERYTLYARDLIDSRQYSEAREILEEIVGRSDGDGMRAGALFLLGKCLDESASDPASAKAARKTLDRFIRDFPTNPRVPAAHRLVAENLARSESYDDSTGMMQSELYAESTTRLKKLLRMLSDEREKGEVEFLIARNHYKAEHLPATLMALEELRQKYVGAPVVNDAAILAARALVKYGRSEEAEAMLRQLVQETPRTAHAAVALQMLAEIAVDSGDFERAIEYSVRWLKDSRTTYNQPDVMLILALAKLETGSTAEALALASQAVKSFPESPRLAEAIVLRGRAHEELGELDEAESSYLEAIELEPSIPRPYMNLARFYRSAGKLPEAIDMMERAGAMAPDEDIMWMELTELYRLNGDGESALALLGVFTYERGLSPDISRAFMMMADIHLEQGDLQDAYRALERLEAIGMTTTNLSAVYDKQGDILDAAGLYDAAVEKYRLAAESGADPVAEKLKIARVLLDNGKAQECFNELDSVERASQPSATKFDLLDIQARALVELERYAEARQAIHEAMALRSGREKFSTLASLMQANLALEDNEAASEIYDLTLKLIDTDDSSKQTPPDSRRIILKWARALYDRGEYARAAEAYSRVSAPGFPAADVAWAIYQRGNCHYHMAEYDRAGELYSRLAAEFADSEWVKLAKARERLISVAAGT